MFMKKITIRKACYIKLGEKGKYEDICLHKKQEMRLGYHEVPHELALSKDKEKIRGIYIKRGQKAGAATDHARQVLEFYGDADTWITFAEGYLWWTQDVSQEVEILGYDPKINRKGSRLRKAINGWNNKSINGHPLIITELSGRLTKVAAYRGTICEISNKDGLLDYLTRRINGEDIPEVAEIAQAREALLKKTEVLIKLLTWQDFELFVDLIFSKSGWQRQNPIGGTQKDLDLELLLPTTQERALVQVKSSTNQQQLNDYIERLSAWGQENKVFYVFHSSRNHLEVGNSGIILVGPEELAEHAFKAGLIDWLIKKVS